MGRFVWVLTFARVKKEMPLQKKRFRRASRANINADSDQIVIQQRCSGLYFLGGIPFPFSRYFANQLIQNYFLNKKKFITPLRQRDPEQHFLDDDDDVDDVEAERTRVRMMIKVLRT